MFRSIWVASLASNLGTWMQNVGAAWLMTAIAPSPIFVALVQAASNLPLFLLALPAGALADVVDRRRLLLASLAWLCIATGLLGALTMAGLATPAWLLGLTFAIGVGSAFLAPAFQAIVPELVSRDELQAAVSLNSISLNLGRAVGPALGGMVVAAAGAGATFVLNALSFVAVLVAIAAWRRAPRAARLPPEDLLGAMRAGIRYVRHSRDLDDVLWRVGTFVLPASAIWALLPLYSRGTLALGAVGYGSLLGCFGAGAVLAGAALSWARERFGTESLATASAFVFAVATAALGVAPLALGRQATLACAGVALFASGGAWLTLLSMLNAVAQSVIPPWVRARALATYLLVLFGGLTGGSALFGALAQAIGVPHALSVAGACVVAGRLAIWPRRLLAGEGPDLSPAPRIPDPESILPIDAERGPVLVTVEYAIDSSDSEAFARAMRAVGEIRLRDGALRWGLWADTTVPGRYLESFVVESWIEHLRQHDRMTSDDRAVQQVARVFHRGGAPPRVTHFIHERIPREV